MRMFDRHVSLGCCSTTEPTRLLACSYELLETRLLARSYELLENKQPYWAMNDDTSFSLASVDVIPVTRKMLQNHTNGERVRELWSELCETLKGKLGQTSEQLDYLTTSRIHPTDLSSPYMTLQLSCNRVVTNCITLV
ncbi:uncharacterized protein LOC128991578 [Macrosteles quadrilineatus]|uniref:uncharacterized protein LOC128991578 n=1 Tax=Macrosteles quadrilineatus TaxID=74068 RepID=UPI0023E16520|nr:uncharacterized protein LOC128991578 [Macrosteles quadrilineatus]